MDRAYFNTDHLSARVEIVTQGRSRLEKQVDIPLGDPRNPLSEAED